MPATSKGLIKLESIVELFDPSAVYFLSLPVPLSTTYPLSSSITTNYGSEQTSQGILLAHNQYISPTDLNYFQQYFSLYPAQISLSNSIGNSHIQNNACSTIRSIVPNSIR